jgi:Uma2 family endonuclease
MTCSIQTPKKVWTEARLQALPEDGHIHELVDGKLVMSPKNDFFHGRICTRLSSVLLAFVEAKGLGEIVDSSTGFWMKNRNCRAPDISFISRERLKALGFKSSTRRFFPGAPELAVEILSPNSRRAEINKRLKDFFGSGTRLAWIIDPDFKRAEICRSPTDRKLIESDGFLEGEDLLPGFRHPVADLFKVWDWE